MGEEQLAETIKQQHEEILVLTQKIQKLQSWLIEADEILSDDKIMDNPENILSKIDA